MTDPSTDPVGTVRDFPRYEYPWLLLNSKGPQRLSNDSVEGCRVIGAVPGTPAAEQHDEAAIEKAARAMFADDLRRGSDAGVPPWTPDRVEEHWTRFLLPERRDRYVSNARAALAALRGE